MKCRVEGEKHFNQLIFQNTVWREWKLSQFWSPSRREMWKENEKVRVDWDV